MIFEKVLDTINRHNLIEKGDKIVVTGGNPFKDVKHTNFLKIEE